jgi:hypothetical protein
MKQFEVGKTYKCHSIGNWDCVWSYTVTARTAQMVTLLSDMGEVKKCRIIKGLSEINNTESVYPLGKYSMCPILRA